MEYFSPGLTRIWLLNRLYRYGMSIYPAYAFRRFGVCEDRLERLGSNYGGWYVPVFDLSADAIVYSAGIGQDVSFDRELISRCGCTIHGFDPTPTAIGFIASQTHDELLASRFVFSPVGLWDSETELQFFAPKTRGWTGSYSALNLQGTEENESISAPVKRLSTLMRDNGHTRIDLLKMDIEGAECRVIDEIIEKAIPIRWLCIEFDQPVPFWTTNRALEGLARAGYQLCKVDSWNFVFHNQKFVTATTKG